MNMLGLAKRESLIYWLRHRGVYGDPEVHPQVEEYWGNVNPTEFAPATTKASGLLKLTFDYHRQMMWTSFAPIFYHIRFSIGKRWSRSQQPCSSGCCEIFLFFNGVWRWFSNEEFLLCFDPVEGLMRLR